MNHYLSLAVELVVGLFALLFLMKLMGRSSISEATPFDFVSVIVLGDFVGSAIYDPHVKVSNILFAITLWGAMILAIDFITLKINISRGLFESTPSLIIQNGVLSRKEMKRNKLDMNRLQSLIREKDAFSIREIEFAILEPDGKISVIKKPMYDTVKKKDLSIPINSISIPVTLISDGVMIKKALTDIQKDEAWLDEELRLRGIKKIKEVFLAEWREEDGLFIQSL